MFFFVWFWQARKYLLSSSEWQASVKSVKLRSAILCTGVFLFYIKRHLMSGNEFACSLGSSSVKIAWVWTQKTRWKTLANNARRYLSRCVRAFRSHRLFCWSSFRICSSFLVLEMSDVSVWTLLFWSCWRSLVFKMLMRKRSGFNDDSSLKSTNIPSKPFSSSVNDQQLIRLLFDWVTWCFIAVSSSFALSVHHAFSLRKGALWFFSVSTLLRIPGAHVETRSALWDSVIFDVFTDGARTWMCSSMVIPHN